MRRWIVFNAIGTFMTSHCIYVLFTSCTLLQHHQCYHNSPPTQYLLHSVKFLGPRIVRVLRFTSFVPTGQNVPRYHSSIFLEKCPSPRLRYMASQKTANFSIDTHASQETISMGQTVQSLRMEWASSQCLNGLSTSSQVGGVANK